ncbi:glycosyltransferase [Candidatus Pelagibacter sp.]|nr:glycosyltransferase [Candidatus Pelagibacter sp.]
MNILHIYSSFESNQGGPPVSIKYLALSQMLKGHNVSILTFFKKKPIIPGVKIINISYYYRRYSIPNFESLIKLKNYINKNDIIHLHGMWNVLISASAFFSKNSKTIISPHGMAVKKNTYNKPILKNIYYNFVDKFCFKFVDGCHFLNNHEKKNSKWIFKDKKFCIQYNLIDTERIKNYILKNKKKTIFRKNFINLVYLGRFNEIKNIFFQLELIKKIKEKNVKILLHLIGPNNNHKSELIEFTKKNKIEKFVKFKNSVFGDKKYLILKNANFVLLTSNYECNSILALETLSSGGLLISNKNCNLDIFSKNKTCIISKNNINNFINIVLNYKNINYKIMKKNAMRYANANLNYKTTKNLITLFYKKL